MKKIILFLLLAYCAAFGAEKEKVAVATFDAKGVPVTDAEIVANFLRSDLVNTQKFIVLDRNNMDKILREQAFQQTGCTSSECAVEIGKILNVKTMIVGTLSKLGDNYYIEANVVDVESSVIVLSFREMCPSLNGIETITKKTAAKLAGIEAPRDSNETSKTANMQQTSNSGSLRWGVSYTSESQTQFTETIKNLSGSTTSSGQKGFVGPASTILITCGNGNLWLPWLADIEGSLGGRIMNLKDMSQNDISTATCSLTAVVLRLDVRFYPFVTLINPNYQNYKTTDAQRGPFEPYFDIGATWYFFTADLDKTDSNVFVSNYSAVGADAKVGVELLNVLFLEYSMHFASSASINWITHNASGVQTGTKTDTFDMNSSGIGVGLKIRF